MSDNVSWILKNNPDSKIVLWAHNGHVWREKGYMGNFLHADYSNNYYNIGCFSNTSTYTAFKDGKLRDDNVLRPNQEGSFEYSFNKTNIPLFYFDFSQLNSDPNCKWLNKSLEHRVVGALADVDYISKCKLSSLYNAVIYIDKTDASKCFSIQK